MKNVLKAFFCLKIILHEKSLRSKSRKNIIFIIQIRRVMKPRISISNHQSVQNRKIEKNKTKSRRQQQQQQQQQLHFVP
jgi:hypothetical protein